eukprot:TRINITY_DN27941_c0_g1_i1.p1 TRINITY_DN27941_c0_g1~~TRINITY_DN27941_c0_g1_i1.p1  ORF type:complete len:191 (-),score=37.07 TRINITY_DN27941_c0_g1_i1:71-643(-)
MKPASILSACSFIFAVAGVAFVIWVGVMFGVLFQEKFAEKTCVVQSTHMYSWPLGKDEQTVYLPEVVVQVNGVHEERRSENVTAYKYRKSFSSTDFATYEPNASSWLESFAPGSTVACWQGIFTPEAVKLGAPNSPKEEARKEQISMILVFLLLVALAVSTCACIVLYFSCTWKDAYRGDNGRENRCCCI